MKIVFLSQIAATLLMTGITWFAQVVHYPLLGLVKGASFREYQIANMRLTTFVVGPLIGVEGVTAFLLLWQRPHSVLLSQVLIGIGLLAVIWLSTAFLQVPKHNILAQGFDVGAHRVLVISNWIRTVAWSLRSLLVLWMVVRVAG